MDCEEIKQKIAEYFVDGKTDDETHDLIDSHLQQCDKCWKYFQTQSKIESIFHDKKKVGSEEGGIERFKQQYLKELLKTCKELTAQEKYIEAFELFLKIAELDKSILTTESELFKQLYESVLKENIDQIDHIRKQYAPTQYDINIFSSLKWKYIGTEVGGGKIGKELIDSIISWFKNELNEEPNNPTLLRNIAYQHIELNEFDEAIKNINLANEIEINPNYHPYYLGILYEEMAKFNKDKTLFLKAEKNYKAALDLMPENESVYNNLAVLYYSFEHLDLAMEYITKAKKLNPLINEIKYNHKIIYTDYENRFKTSNA